MRCINILIGFVFYFLFTHCSYSAVKSPVVIIPGVLGSKLCRDTESKYLIWGAAIPLQYFTELKLPLTNEYVDLDHKECGLLDNFTFIGPIKSNKYEKLITLMEGLGYELEKDLFIFSYDWRLSNFDNAERLSNFIEQNIEANSVDIIAHSMGGLVARAYIYQYGGNERVDKLITMGTPHLGSVAAFQMLDEGYDFFVNLLNKGVVNIRETITTFPSMYELMPHYDGCCFSKDEFNNMTEFDIYDSGEWLDIGWFPESLNNVEGESWLRETLNRSKALHKIMRQPIEVNHIEIVNSLLDTPHQFVLSDGKVEYYKQRGDGVVYEISAGNNKLYNARPSIQSHQNIFDDKSVLQVFRWVLFDGQEPTSGPGKYVIEDVGGKKVSISGVGISLSSAVASPNETIELTLRFVGEADLEYANLENVKIYVDDIYTSSVVTKELGDKSPSRVEVNYKYNIIAPPEYGNHKIHIDIKGLGELEDYFIVVQDV